MRQRRTVHISDVVALLAVPGLLLGLISILWSPVDKTGWAAGMTLDDILVPLLKLGGITGLVLLVIAIAIAIYEQFGRR